MKCWQDSGRASHKGTKNSNKCLCKEQIMKKTNYLKMIGIFSAIMLLFALISCGDGAGGGGGPLSVVYEGYTSGAGGKSYTLTITENPDRAAYKPVAGDKYKLVIKKDEDPEKVSTGFVLGVSGQTFTLQPSAAPYGEPVGTEAPTFDVTVNTSGGITNIEEHADITLDDGEAEEGPGHVNPGPELYVMVNVGDRGPGGGVIFYKFDEGVDLGDGYIVHFLEAAPVVLGPVAWVSDDFYRNLDPEDPEDYDWDYKNAFVPDTEYGIGYGMWNTSQIIGVDPNAPAAAACYDYTKNGFNDWFLPSPDELFALMQVTTDHPAHLKFCWTSKQDESRPEMNNPWAVQMFYMMDYNPNPTPYYETWMKSSMEYVVPIRGVMYSDFEF